MELVIIIYILTDDLNNLKFYVHVVSAGAPFLSSLSAIKNTTNLPPPSFCLLKLGYGYPCKLNAIGPRFFFQQTGNFGNFLNTFLYFFGTSCFEIHLLCSDRLGVLVVRVLDYRSRGMGSIPGTTRFSEK
jgi:hypothetical protein